MFILKFSKASWQYLFWKSDGKCYPIFKQGYPCPATMELVFDSSTKEAKCQCPSGRLYWEEDGRCYEPFTPGFQMFSPFLFFLLSKIISLNLTRLRNFLCVQVLVPKAVSFTRVKKCNHVECSDKIRSVERFIKCRSVGQVSFNIKDAGGYFTGLSLYMHTVTDSPPPPHNLH